VQIAQYRTKGNAQGFGRIFCLEKQACCYRIIAHIFILVFVDVNKQATVFMHTFQSAETY